MSAPACTRESHEAAKLDDATWKSFSPHLPWFDGEQWLESRHCLTCGSTLVRPYEGLRIRRDASNVTVSLPARASGTATRHEWVGMAPRIFVHGEASDPMEAAMLGYIAAKELSGQGGSK